MHQRGRNWTARILCALLSLLLIAPALAFAATEPAGHGSASAASEEEHGGGGLISLDKSLIVQGINFLLLLLVLNFLLYKPLVGKMQERSEAIRKSLDEAQAVRAEAARQQEENAARLRTAYQEAAAIRDQALKEAADEQRKLVENAQAEARRLVDGARAQTEADIRRAREELRREVAGLAVAVAEKLVRKSLRDEDHRRIVDDAIAKIGA